ncbi:MAG: DUF4249 family protein [Bacteroidales bacterium]
MKNTVIYITYVVFITIIMTTLVSCEDFFYSDLEEKYYIKDENKLVVSAFISPDVDTQRIYISKSRIVYNTYHYNDDQHISNADVKIIHNSNEYPLTFEPSTFSYIIPNSEINVTPAQNYQLNVKCHDYPTASAQCVVYDKNIAYINHKGIDIISSSYDTYAIYEFSFSDIANECNIYDASLTVIGRDGETDSFFLNNINDLNNDGNDINLSFYRYFSHSVEKEELAEMDSLYIVKVFVYGKYAGDFLSSAYENQNGVGDVFYEPVHIKSNVSNGLGVFGSYRVFEKRFYSIAK